MTNTPDSLDVTVDSGRRSHFSLFYKWVVRNSVFIVKGTAQHEHVFAQRNSVHFDNYGLQDRILHRPKSEILCTDSTHETWYHNKLLQFSAANMSEYV
jgi:hypothetical protein